MSAIDEIRTATSANLTRRGILIYKMTCTANPWTRWRCHREIKRLEREWRRGRAEGVC